MKPIAIIKAGTTDAHLREAYGDFEDWTARSTGLPGHAFTILNVQNIDKWQNTFSYSAIIVTGSHSDVTERLDWMPRLESFVRAAQQQGIPLLGICFGHQLLANAFGGRVENNPLGAEYGAVTVELTENGQNNALFKDVPQTFRAFMSHRQTVVRLPENAVRLAVSPRDKNAAFFLPPSVWGVQFHPEFDRRIMKHYLKNHYHISETDSSSYLSDTASATKIMHNFVSLRT